MGIKGAREQIATVKPYQDNRTKKPDPVRSARVVELRNRIANYSSATAKPVVNALQEADDSLCQMQTERIKRLGVESSVIMSGDKDLWMVQGYHCDSKTGERWLVDGYGSTEIRPYINKNDKPDKKPIGYGTSFFWFQMLAGDSADNIPGLPAISGELNNKYFPTKKYNPNRGARKCGDAAAITLLEHCRSDKEAFNRVFECYQSNYGKLAMERIFEQAFLLWMRRTKRLTDVIEFFAEFGVKLQPSPKQLEAFKEYKRIANIMLEQMK